MRTAKGDEVKRMRKKKKRVLPGFGLSLGFTMLYMSLFVLIPLSIVFIQTSRLGWKKFAGVITNERVLHSYQVSLQLHLRCYCKCHFRFINSLGARTLQVSGNDY